VAFVRAPVPQAALAAVTQALADLSNRSDRRNALGGRQTLSASQGLPIYVLELDHIGRQGETDKARFVGWRVIVFDEQGMALADSVDTTGEGAAATFSRLVRGPLVESLIQAGEVAQAAANAVEDFEPRVLEAPALHTAALWLVGNHEQLFIPYQGAGDLLRIDPGFLSALADCADRRREAEAVALNRPNGRLR
jgi:hypothetical protein